MKFKNILIGTSILAVIAFSCKKEESSSSTTTTTTGGATTSGTTTGGATTGGTTTSGAVTYSEGGVNVNCDSANATLYTNVVSNTRMIDVYAFKSGNQVLEMHFSPKTGAQTVGAAFDKAWLTYTTFSGSTMLDYYDGTSGAFNLTACDTTSAGKIVGTFNFSGPNPTSTSTKTLTSGTINITKIKKQ